VTRAALRLAAGVIGLEFAAAVTAFVSATLLPTVATALDARAHLGLLLAGPGVATAAPDEPAQRPVVRTLLVPAGGALLLATRSPVPIAAGAVVALVGVAGLLPAGTARLRSGPPAALAAMLLFATGWFGADGLVTVLFTDGYGTSVGRAAIVLSAAPLAWAVTSLATPRTAPPAVGLALAATGVAVVAASSSYGLGLVAWTLAGAGVGLAYPGLYLRCTPASGPAAALATAVITAEALGALLGSAAGGVLASTAGLTPAYGAFAAVLVLAALAATRSASRPAPVGVPA
jgi:hypothetical protein